MTESLSVALYEPMEIHCPRLGCLVTFGYCSTEDLERPCANAITCWEEHFNAEVFFRDFLCHEEYVHRFYLPPKGKIETLIEAIEQAKKTPQRIKDEDQLEE